MIKPLRDYVVLEGEPEERNVGGLVIKSKENDNGVATVVAVGPGAKNEKGEVEPLDVKVGDKVLYKKYSTNDYKQGDKKYLVIRSEDIIAIVD